MASAIPALQKSRKNQKQPLLHKKPLQIMCLNAEKQGRGFVGESKIFCNLLFGGYIYQIILYDAGRVLYTRLVASGILTNQRSESVAKKEGERE